MKMINQYMMKYEKNKLIEVLELKINSLSKKDIFQYLRYLKGDEE